MGMSKENNKLNAQVSNLYDKKIEVSPNVYPFVRAEDHTMGRRLFVYIKDRVPGKYLDKIIQEGKRIEIHGIYDGHIEIVKEKLGWDKYEYKGTMVKPGRYFKSQYPKLYKVWKGSEEFYALTVFPGKEYVDHNASLIKNYIERKKAGLTEEVLRVFRYPDAEENVYTWSDIGKAGIVKEGDVIIIGYDVTPLLYNGFDIYDRVSYAPLFEWIIMKNKRGHRILFFGFFYNYWGSIIGRIAEGFYEDGARLVIHLANLGSCREPEDIGSIFLPMFFTKIEKGKVYFIENPWNPLLEIYWDYNSGIHTCVGSLLEETYKPFRETVTRMGITSVETEAFHIINAVSNAKKQGKENVGFAGIYIATDYVRKEKEKGLRNLPCDLTTRAKKRMLLNKKLPLCVSLIADYLQELTTTPKLS